MKHYLVAPELSEKLKELGELSIEERMRYRAPDKHYVIGEHLLQTNRAIVNSVYPEHAYLGLNPQVGMKVEFIGVFPGQTKEAVACEVKSLGYEYVFTPDEGRVLFN